MSIPSPSPQRDRLLKLLKRRGMARQAEFQQQGITAATASRLVRDGSIVRLSRGLYQLSDAPMDAHHALAEAAKRVPKGVVCLISALAFHDLTDQLPAKVWIALGRKDWTPRVEYPPLRIARFSEQDFRSGIETHRIEGVKVSIYSVPKTLADAFRYRREIGISVCIESLRAALKSGKANPADIAKQAVESGIWKVMQPYLETLTTNG
ncbi:MAG: type IV toxin-antitoxin system AbiEi family antitoxin domain-containing protein [Panacagrimonas sp.]